MPKNYERKFPKKLTLLELEIQAATAGGTLYFRAPPIKEITDTARIIDLVKRNGELLLDRSFDQRTFHTTLCRHRIGVHTVVDEAGQLQGYRLFKKEKKT